METLMPSISKPEGPLTVCNCIDTNIRQEQKNALRIVRAKKGIVHIIDPLLVPAPIMMDIFQELRVNSKLFFAFQKHNRFDF